MIKNKVLFKKNNLKKNPKSITVENTNYLYDVSYEVNS